MDMKKYKGTKKLTWTDEAIEAYQELYFLEDTVTPILQTDASDYGIGGYLYMIVNHQVLYMIVSLLPVRSWTDQLERKHATASTMMLSSLRIY